MLRDGEGLFVIQGEVPVGLQRYASGPIADGRIRISIFTEMRSVTPEMAQHDARLGLAAVAAAEAADARLTDLLAQFGAAFELVYDYEIGFIKVGDVARDGKVNMV